MHLFASNRNFYSLNFKEAFQNKKSGDLSLLYSLLKTNIRNTEEEVQGLQYSPRLSYNQCP